jgi:hypothetical protein
MMVLQNSHRLAISALSHRNPSGNSTSLSMKACDLIFLFGSIITLENAVGAASL